MQPRWVENAGEKGVPDFVRARERAADSLGGGGHVDQKHLLGTKLIVKKSALLAGIATSVAGAVVACSYEALNVAETNTVLTLRDEGRKYSEYKTYALSDGVFELCGLQGDDDLGDLPAGGGAGGFGGRSGLVERDDCFDVEHDFDDSILRAITSGMKGLGYERVEMAADPDVVLLVGTVARDFWFQSPSYVWCDPYFGYQCWYPDETTSYSLPIGSVLINMIDVGESKEDDLKSVWFASVSGIFVDSNDQSVSARIEQGFAQAFEQSAYLEAGGDQ